MTSLSSRLLAALIGVDAVGATIAVRRDVRGEPFGIGASLDVRTPAVLVFWGSGLSAPLASLAGAAVARRIWPRGLRTLGVVFAVGALSEPVFWGRRPCSLVGRVVLVLHVLLAAAIAVAPCEAATSAGRRRGLVGDQGPIDAHVRDSHRSVVDNVDGERRGGSTRAALVTPEHPGPPATSPRPAAR